MRISIFNPVFVIEHPSFDPHPEKSTTNNHAWRQGLFVVFRDRFGHEFQWMPRWADIEELNKKRVEVDLINKRLCAQHNGGGEYGIREAIPVQATTSAATGSSGVRP